MRKLARVVPTLHESKRPILVPAVDEDRMGAFHHAEPAQVHCTGFQNLVLQTGQHPKRAGISPHGISNRSGVIMFIDRRCQSYTSRLAYCISWLDGSFGSVERSRVSKSLEVAVRTLETTHPNSVLYIW